MTELLQIDQVNELETRSPASHESSDALVLTQVVLRIADLWSLSDRQLGAILSLCASRIFAMRTGERALEPASRSFEAAQVLMRLFRSMQVLLGSDDAASQRWLRTENLDLGATPLDRMQTFGGLVKVCDYVEGYRSWSCSD